MTTSRSTMSLAALLVMVAIALLAAGCGGGSGPTEPPPVNPPPSGGVKVTISPSDVTVKPTQIQCFDLTFEPAVSTGKIVWGATFGYTEPFFGRMCGSTSFPGDYAFTPEWIPQGGGASVKAPTAMLRVKE